MRLRIKRIYIAIALPIVALGFIGCDLVNSLTATTQVASVVLRSPDLSQTVSAIDSQLATAMTASLGNLETNLTTVIVGVGKRAGELATAAPDPVNDATVKLRYGNQSIEVCSTGTRGGYAATSLGVGTCGNSALSYIPGVDYTTEVTADGVLGNIVVNAAAAINSGNVRFTPTIGSSNPFGGNISIPTHGGGGLTVDWSNDPTAGNSPTLVTIFRVRFTGTTAANLIQGQYWQADANPVFDSAPRQAGEIFQQVLLKDYDKNVAVPSTAFTSRGLYFVVITVANIEATRLSNLSIGSGAMAGTGTAFLFWMN